ncbi:2-amino-4-hydroxy-6-hydroxymethyldihydropteridine diphosphokinase [Sphingobium nicotianae]|uniref:2-amino-4-hydroxy-6-hydroxymethyldihydropteridine pyrophosphokinase n=1 Tax=Sphingobium nicotianae TaxID=2782607 RepID=A0A9X1DCR5_9SPHN|nr:2-amino-4-hydroxy-6-hydroxymethyldihydropteridine diphosphokinase [Sphingobium nicotianae]MBT2187494.1 2-amino-4-hydroxy-6-hydroxymethyldihydropteridine diphosphokinase [Sphingobium nicotianae]
MAKARKAGSKKQPAKSAKHLYAIGIGSNRPLAGNMGPRRIVHAATIALDRKPLRCIARSPIIASRPIGPSQRTYANAVALVKTALPPLAMLDALQTIEALFGRRRYRRWGARSLDLDLLLWSGGRMRHKRLIVPHPFLRTRSFVLGPLAAVAPAWRDPVSGLTVRQLAARLARPKPVDPAARSL